MLSLSKHLAEGALLCEIKEDNYRRVSDRCVVTRKGKSSSFLIHTKDGNVVTALVAAIQETASWVESETAWIISMSPFFPNKLQITIGTDRKDYDAVVQAVSGVDMPPIVGNQDF